MTLGFDRLDNRSKGLTIYREISDLESNTTAPPFNQKRPPWHLILWLDLVPSMWTRFQRELSGENTIMALNKIISIGRRLP